MSVFIQFWVRIGIHCTNNKIVSEVYMYSELAWLYGSRYALKCIASLFPIGNRNLNVSHSHTCFNKSPCGRVHGRPCAHGWPCNDNQYNTDGLPCVQHLGRIYFRGTGFWGVVIYIYVTQKSLIDTWRKVKTCCCYFDKFTMISRQLINPTAWRRYRQRRVAK